MGDDTHLGWSDWSWLASLLAIGCLTLGLFALTADRFTGGQGGVPLDDAWIHFQFARNLARGDGLSFNPGQPTSGSTAPLWTLLLAGVYCVGGRFPLVGQLLSGACFLAALVATYVLGKRLTGRRWTAWLAGAVVAANGRFAWAGLSGLETPLFAVLSLAGIAAYLSDRAAGRYRLRTSALFGLAALSRPEGYLLFALALVDLVLQIANQQISKSANQQIANRKSQITEHASRFAHHVSRITHYALRITLPFSVLVLPYLLFSLKTSGHLLPNTYHAKAVIDFRPDLDFLSLAARYLVLDNPLLLPFYVLGLGILFRRARLLSLWSAGLPLIYAFLHAVLYQHGRYLIPLIPCNALIGVVGLVEARRYVPRLRTLTPTLSLGGRGSIPPSLTGRGRGRVSSAMQEGPTLTPTLSLGGRGSILPSLTGRGRGSIPPSLTGRGGGRVGLALICLLVVAGTAWRLPTMAGLYAWNVDNVNQMHVALGHWVAENTPPDALLALNDIGAITYISERPVVDLAGLVTPEVVPLLRAPDRDARLTDFMAAQGVQYVIIFPNWFPGLAARSDVLEPVHQVTLERNTIAGGQTMVVYEAHWRK